MSEDIGLASPEFGLIIDFWKDGTATMAENERHESEDELSPLDEHALRNLGYEDGCTPGGCRRCKLWRTAGPAWLSEEATRNAPSRSENASNAKGLRNGSCPADGYDGLAP